MTEKLYCEVKKSSQLGQDFSVKGVLNKLEMSSSGYYSFHNRKPSKSAIKRDFIMDKILETYDYFKQIYGAPKLQKELQKQGIFVGERTVSEYMKQLNIHACWVKKSIRTTINPDFSLKLNNILAQHFNPENPNEIWCTDITYIWTMEGFVYLCCIMELYSRKIVSWELSDSLDSETVVRAIKKAVHKRNCKPKIIHTDRGCQFVSTSWSRATIGIEKSYSKKAFPWDNACIESFHSLIKREWLNRFCIRDMAHARALIFEYIDAFYNTQRIHSHCEYLSPDEFELKRSDKVS